MKKFWKFIGILHLVIFSIAFVGVILEIALGIDISVALFISVSIVLPSIFFIRSYIRNPFKSPYETITIDVSGRRNVDMADVIDEYLMADNGGSFYRYHANVMNWKQNCEDRINKSVWKRRRRKQFESLINDGSEFTFRTVRTRSKGAYNETYVDNVMCVTYDLMRDRNDFLNKIDYSMTINEFEKELQKKERANKKKAVLARF